MNGPLMSSEGYIWVLEYGITHSRSMVLCVHQGDFPKGSYVKLFGVQFFHGLLEGGPYSLLWSAGELIGTAGNEIAFRVVFESAEVVEVR
jgi:hypothetical protein